MDDPRKLFYNNRVYDDKEQGEKQNSTRQTQRESQQGGIDTKKLQQLADKYTTEGEN